jgi:hypothetical protein
LRCGDAVFREGDLLSIDGDSGAVYAGAIASSAAIDPYLSILRDWSTPESLRASA